MLYPYMERVWSFGYVFSWEVIHYWLEYAHKKKKKQNKTKQKSALFIILFSIEHMYGCASLIHWVYVLEKVHMGASFRDSILVYVLGECMSRPFNFCERGERLFFRIFGSLPYSSLHPFSCDLSFCFDAGWPSLTFLSFCLLLSLFYSSISLYLIWFISFLILVDVWLGFDIHTLFFLIWCVHSFIITFQVGILRSVTHEVFLRIASHAWGEVFEEEGR